MTSKKEFLKVTVVSEALAKALGVKAGERVKVECRKGVPVERYWRNRFKDAPTDGAIALPVPPKKNKPAKEKGEG